MTFQMNCPPMFGGILPALSGGTHPVLGACVNSMARGTPAAWAAPAVSSATPRKNKGGKTKSNRSPRRKVDVVMGVDFGTAFTKIVIRAPYEPGGEDTAHAVEFGKIPDNPCMLHSAVWIDDDGFCWVEKGQGRKMFPGIKVGVISSPNSPEDSNEAFAQAAAYLGIVIRGARNWFTERRSFGGNVDLNWQYHIGIPAETARGPLADSYSRLVNAALTLSESRKVSIQAAKREAGRYQVSGRIGWIPEVIAQAYGYARAPVSDEGIHVMVDIGAWTLDVCSFNNRAQDDALTLHAAKVAWLGCMHLHHERMSAVGRAVMPDQFCALPRPEEYSQSIRRQGSAIIRDTDGAFRNKCEKIIGGLFSTTLQQWRIIIERSSLPVIICGGGSSIPLFKKAVQQGWDEARKARQTTAKARFIPLPSYNLIGRGVNDENRHRFSVAWGLSHPDISHRLNVPPPQPRPPSDDYRNRYIGKEQV